MLGALPFLSSDYSREPEVRPGFDPPPIGDLAPIVAASAVRACHRPDCGRTCTSNLTQASITSGSISSSGAMDLLSELLPYPVQDLQDVHERAPRVLLSFRAKVIAVARAPPESAVGVAPLAVR
jgi:hypothetical protein